MTMNIQIVVFQVDPEDGGSRQATSESSVSTYTTTPCSSPEDHNLKAILATLAITAYFFVPGAATVDSFPYDCYKKHLQMNRL
jgi:hypothetical protein